MACDVLEGRLEAPGGTILREGGWVLDHSVSPCVLRGWLILKPERHVVQVAELTAEESASLGPLIQKATSTSTSSPGMPTCRDTVCESLPRCSPRSGPGDAVMRRRRRQLRQYGASLAG